MFHPTKVLEMISVIQMDVSKVLGVCSHLDCCYWSAWLVSYSLKDKRFVSFICGANQCSNRYLYGHLMIVDF